MVEFALVAPMLLLIMFGIIGYGGYFWRAHALQQVANDGARAALAGLTARERGDLARAAVRAELAGMAGIESDRASIDVAEATDTITVRLSYDASSDAFFSLGLVPMPSAQIRRSAIVRLGGL